MPKDCAAFLSQPGGKADIKLYPTGDVSYTIKYLNKVTRASQKTMLKQRAKFFLIDRGQTKITSSQTNLVKERNQKTNAENPATLALTLTILYHF